MKKIKKIAHRRNEEILNITRFHYRDDPSNLWSKDFEFSIKTLKQHWQCGYNEAFKALQRPTWLEPPSEHQGIVFHEF